MGRQPMTTGMDDVERQAEAAVHGDPEILEQKNKDKRDWCGAVAVLFIAVCFCAAVLTMILHREVHYYVAIDSVSGLDQARGLSVNLTLGVSSWTGAKACIKPGTYVDVSYRGVKLAASEPQMGRLCAGPWKSVEQRVTASGDGVAEGQILYELVAVAMKQRVAVFDVALHLPAGSYGRFGTYDGKACVSQCGGMWVGAAAAALCDAPKQI